MKKNLNFFWHTFQNIAHLFGQQKNVANFKERGEGLHDCLQNRASTITLLFSLYTFNIPYLIRYSDGPKQNEPESTMVLCPEIADYEFDDNFLRPNTEDKLPMYPAAKRFVQLENKKKLVRIRKLVYTFSNPLGVLLNL